nr:MAG TPA: hypothetical protein [Caudoviricetes sp.]
MLIPKEERRGNETYYQKFWDTKDNTNSFISSVDIKLICRN